MRTLYSIITISTLVILFFGISSAEMSGDTCQGQKPAEKTMKFENCCCSLGQELSAAHGDSYDRVSGTGCCPPESCTKTFVPERIALLTVSSVDYTFSGGKTEAIFQPETPLYSALDRLELPPPRAPASPIYLQYCSLII